MRAWLAAFLFTQFVEVPIYSYALGGRPWVAFGASAITHPFVWFVFPWLVPHHYSLMAVLAESFAFIVEAYYLERFGLGRAAWAWSLVSNASSLSLGLLSRELLGWP